MNNLEGQKFGRLLAVRYIGKSKWLCKCECGNEKEITSYNLGFTKSCGCLAKEMYEKNKGKKFYFGTHNKSNTRLYNIWQGMKYRCKCKDYKNYCLKGIRVCEEWENSFEAFYEWAQRNGYSDTLTIDRKDGDKGYSPDNCRWVDAKTQANNKSKSAIQKREINKKIKKDMEFCKTNRIRYVPPRIIIKDGVKKIIFDDVMLEKVLYIN